MTLTIQKKREIFFVEETAKIIGKNWELGPDRESPDFIITEGTKQFGLEVSEIFTGEQNQKGSSVKAKECNVQKALDSIRKEYEKLTNIILNVKLVGDTSKENLSLIMPALIQHDFISKSEHYHCIIDTHKRLRIHVTKLSSSFYNTWINVSDRVGWVNRNAMPEITRAVEEKSKKLSQYRQDTGLEIHLLLVANRLNNSGKLILESFPTLDRHGFKNVYFYSYPESVTIFDNKTTIMHKTNTPAEII